MLVDIGPVGSAEVKQWTRFARRVVAEVRTDPADLEGVATDDLLFHWSRLIDQWAAEAEGSDTFRWSIRIDSELGEYLLHGLERCLHSPGVRARVTPAEAALNRSFTRHVVSALVVGLEVEGRAHAQMAGHVRASLGGSLD